MKLPSRLERLAFSRRLLRRVEEVWIRHWPKIIQSLILPAGIGAVMIYLKCADNDRARLASSLELRPILNAIGGIRVTSLNCRVDLEPIYDKWWMSKDFQDTLNVETVPELSFTVILRNDGKGFAKYLGHVFSDTIAGAATLREIVQSQEKQSQVGFKPIDTTFQINKIAPGDSLTLTDRIELCRMRDQRAILHFMVIYQDDFGTVFDTYAWKEVRLNNFAVAWITFPPRLAPSPVVVLEGKGFVESETPHVEHSGTDYWSKDIGERFLRDLRWAAEKSPSN